MKLQPIFAANFYSLTVMSSCLSSNSNFQGIKESQDELTFFPESSGNARNLDGMSHPLLKSYRGYSQPQYQGITDNSKETKQLEEQHCFILGTDFKSPNPIKVDKELETQNHLHHFFGEWPPKNTDSWLDLAPNSKVHNGNYSFLFNVVCFYSIFFYWILIFY